MWGWLFGKDEEEKQYDRRERLSFMDDTTMYHNYHVTSLTYLARKRDGDSASAGAAETTEAFLQRRSADVVRKNPYLVGDFVKEGNSTFLAWHDTPSDESVAATMRVLRGDAKLNALLGRVRAVQEGTAEGSVDGLFREVTHHFSDTHAVAPTERRWIVYLVDLSEDGDASGDYALVTAMVHSLGDGRTYYSLHNMLSADAEPYALDPKRDDQLGNPANRKFLPPNTPPYDNVFVTGILPSALYVALRSMAYAAVGRTAPPPVGCTFAVDHAFVEAEKKRVATDPNSPEPFVSTNDILSSFFLGNLPATYNTQHMALSTRGRIPGHTDTMVGNYIDAAVFSRQDTITPTLIRSMLKKGGPATLAERTHMPHWKRYRDLFACITNWSQYHVKISTPAHEEQFMFPLVKPGGTGTVCIIHAWADGKLAMTFNVDARSPEVVYRTGGPLGKQLM